MAEEPNQDPAVTPQPTVVSTPPARRQKFLSAGLSGQLPLVLALLIIIGLLALWQPWQANPSSSDRTITVTGEAIVTAEPDEYTFAPSYQFSGSSAQTALAAANEKINSIVDKLKSLGVPDNKIKSDTSGFQDYYNQRTSTYYASVSVVVDNKALAQKVQDYLLTTTPDGSVTPQADFSKAKRKQLTDSARDQASKDARAKADQSAKNLGFKVGKVKSVKDEPDTSFFEPCGGRGICAGVNSAATDSVNTAPIHQGENDLTYDVTVTYYLR